MGLDITAFSNLHPCTEAGDHEMHYTSDGGGCRHFYANDDFKDRAEGVEGDLVGDEKFSFRAGSYSGYNEWRRMLCYAIHGVPPNDVWANPAKFPRAMELINFSDTEGTIGPKTAAKLLADLEGVEYDDGDGWFMERLNDWRKAFKIASNNGAVKFH